MTNHLRPIWAPPITPDLDDHLPSAARHLAGLYDLLNADRFDWDDLAHALDRLARDLDDHIVDLHDEIAIQLAEALSS